jgi:NAD(P)-dependent dehydrogenase (short-subunit alcohol dehydrogenase family)
VKTAIVTGASRGVGLETARGLLAAGHYVVLAVRDAARGEAAVKEIGGGEVMRLDVADLESVRAFGDAFLGRHGRLDVLVNNAGIHTAQRGLTPQGIERTFATNHLGHFLLACLLIERLKASAPARIVNVASEAHRGGRLDLDDLMGERRWSGIRAYTQSKLANIMFTYALARRLAATGVTVNAVHPGSVRTGWARGSESGLFRHVVALASPFLLSPARGARMPLRVATDPALAEVSGRYFVRGRERASSATSRDVAAQERLWRVSEGLTGCRFPEPAPAG